MVQTARIQVEAPPSYVTMVLLGVLFLGVLGGLVWWGIRVTRR